MEGPGKRLLGAVFGLDLRSLALFRIRPRGGAFLRPGPAHLRCRKLLRRFRHPAAQRPVLFVRRSLGLDPARLFRPERRGDSAVCRPTRPGPLPAGRIPHPTGRPPLLASCRKRPAPQRVRRTRRRPAPAHPPAVEPVPASRRPLVRRQRPRRGGPLPPPAVAVRRNRRPGAADLLSLLVDPAAEMASGLVAGTRRRHGARKRPVPPCLPASC